MRRGTRHGFTFVEVLVVMVVLSLLATIGVPRIRNMKERAYFAAMRSDLGTLRTAEEAYFAENQAYATRITDLDFKPSTEVNIVVQSGNARLGWRALATHTGVGGTCVTSAGDEAVGVESGSIACTVEAPFGTVAPTAP
jgi:prepilin-type N-terminal cleavage/methylation domain-containing protein